LSSKRPQYEQKKCKEYSHLQMARCVSKEDDATVSTNMQSVLYRAQIDRQPDVPLQ